MPCSKDFSDFEGNADSFVINLVKGRPIRGLITLIHVMATSTWIRLGYDERIEKHGLGPRKAGYLAKLFSETDPRFVGSSAYDVLHVWGTEADSLAAVKCLFAYADLCEVAPSVHKGFLIDRTQGNVCELSWKSSSYADFEARDIVLSNLFYPFSLHDPHWHRSWFMDKADAPDQIQYCEYIEKLIELTSIFEGGFFEISTLSNDAMQKAVGVSMHKFRKFRSACMALAEFHELLADAVRTRFHETEPDFIFSDEVLDEIVPCWPIDHIDSLLARLAEIDVVDVKKLMAVYSFVAGCDELKSEGFFPPFVVSDDSYIFSTASALHMMSSRNIAYSCLQKNSSHFEKEVSKHLEPRLIDVAELIFGCMKGVRVKRNIIWDGGEIDLLVCQESEKTVLLIEAKAVVAPDGMRMVRNAESRINEGICQLDKFFNLSMPVREGILSRAFGGVCNGVKVVGVVLTWAGFGTENVWSKLEKYTAINIPLLAYLVYQNPGLKLCEFDETCSNLIEEVIVAANPAWETAESCIGNLSLYYPKLNTDSSALAKYRVALHKLFLKNEINYF